MVSDLLQESIADSEYSNISNIESPINSQSKSGHQLQSRVTVSDLLQISNSGKSDDDVDYTYQSNYKEQTKANK
ncbi:hypothetical protein F8M41_002692 [Gigaspora margarita]|uniref:Uncharacterized protein n=1 Tax=Gigaspora margarita TaxID=4874 RepID=A0A8H4AYH7_GIGMA|nr:hypothetical protein F8M41_002692 [Gigaspora margarita]